MSTSYQSNHTPLLGKGFSNAPGLHAISTFLPDIFLRTKLFILVVVINDDKITYDKLSGLNCPHLKWSNL